MPKPEQPQEIEIKLRISEAPALQLRLKNLHANEIIPRTYESNTLYDTPQKSLTRRGQLIRIRIEQTVPKGNKTQANKDSSTILTYKGPLRKTSSKTKATKAPQRRFKIREELEITIQDGEQMPRILSAMGLHPVFRYEKFRTTYALPGIEKLKVEFDETPIGLFLELEGGASSIDRAAKLLGYGQSDYMTQTYGDLYIAECRKRRIKPTDMLFSSKKLK